MLPTGTTPLGARARTFNMTARTHRIAVSVFFFLAGCLFSSWASRIPTVKDRFHLNEAELGAVLFMLPIGSFIALPFAGWWVSKFGSRFTTTLAALCMSVLLITLGFCNTVAQISVTLFAFGFFADTMNIAANTQALDVQDIYQRPLMSSFHGLWSLGAMTGAVTGGWMMKINAGMNAHFLGLGIPSIILSIIFYFYLVNKDQVKTSAVIFAWPDKSLMLLGAICFCCTLCEGAMADWSSLYYRQVLQDAGGVSTTGYTAFTLTMATGRLIGDRVIHWLGNRTVLIGDGLLIAGGLALALGVQNPVAVIAGFSMVGLGVATVIPIVYTLAGSNKKMSPSVALAAVSTVGFTGFLFGPPVIGFIAHETGLRLALVLVLVLALVIVVLAGKMRITGTS